MNYAVVITDTAKQDLRAIAVWIAEQSMNIEIAKHFIQELSEECSKLDICPDRGSLPNDRVLKSLGYRFITYRDYLIFYMVDENNHTVNIMAVFNCKKDYIRVMKKFI